MGVTDRLQEMAEAIVSSEGMELVDVEYRREGAGWVVRLYIDKAGGVTHDDCREVSEQVSARLEVEDLIPHRYTLEVSSPGLDRILKKREDFERFAGRGVQIRLDAPIDGRRRFQGRLEGIRDDRVLLTMDSGERLELPFARIARARLRIEL